MSRLGFPSDHLLSFRLRPIGPFDRDYAPFYAEVLDRLKQSPVVRTATLTTDIPLSDEDFSDWAHSGLGSAFGGLRRAAYHH
jgi:hypothetical protein